MADHLEASVTLPSDPASVSAARAYVLTTLAEWGLPPDTEVADTIRLIVSELTTNAVQHTLGQSPTFTVDLALDRDEHLRIGVTDSHPRFPKRLPAAVQQDNGLPFTKDFVIELDAVDLSVLAHVFLLVGFVGPVQGGLHCRSPVGLGPRAAASLPMRRTKPARIDKPFSRLYPGGHYRGDTLLSGGTIA